VHSSRPSKAASLNNAEQHSPYIHHALTAASASSHAWKVGARQALLHGHVPAPHCLILPRAERINHSTLPYQYLVESLMPRPFLPFVVEALYGVSLPFRALAFDHLLSHALFNSTSKKHGECQPTVGRSILSFVHVINALHSFQSNEDLCLFHAVPLSLDRYSLSRLPFILIMDKTSTTSNNSSSRIEKGLFHNESSSSDHHQPTIDMFHQTLSFIKVKTLRWAAISTFNRCMLVMASISTVGLRFR
jgi:hypothetical protein